jgi:choline dehydrogenase
MTTSYDYIVVGAGAAGAVVASRLSEDPGCRVLLLEAGPKDHSIYIHVPAGLKQLGVKYDWRYTAEADPSRNGVVDNWAAGKVLGGSSSINGMVWVRGNLADYDGWAAQGAAGWDWKGVAPYFRKAETYTGPTDSDRRGKTGPQHVEACRVSHPLTEAFIDAAEQAGHPHPVDYNGASQRGVSRGQHSQKRGWRQSTARAYLAPARRRKNLTIVTRAHARRVLIENGTAVGVEYETPAGIATARAEQEVVLSAGSLATPKLLMLSGIGPADELAAHGIPVISDVPGLGANLQDHPATLVRFAVNVRTLNQEMTAAGAVRHGLDFVVRGRGAVTSPFGTANLFGPPDNPDGSVDYQAIFCPFSLDGGDSGDDGTVFAKIEAQASGDNEALGGTNAEPAGETFKHDIHDMKLAKVSAIDVTTYIVHPVGRGRVRLRSAHPEADPLIEYQMLGEDADIIGLANACRAVREVFAQPALKGVVVAEEIPGPAVQTDDEWRAHLHAVSFRAQHPVGTCRMGTDENAVVDPQLRVRGVTRLRVADASVMPSVTSGNTNSPTIMIGEKAADLIRGRNHG